ncbi:MAG: type II toxin-antitoxin system VapC family toxin [Gemmatimonadota bacterium]
MLVIDTGALVCWTLDPGRLSAAASAALDGSDGVRVSAISLWELGAGVRGGRVELPVSVREYAGRLARVDGVAVLPVDEETWLKSLELEWDCEDVADRAIVATAALRGCPLVTSDPRMRAFYPEAVW